MHHRKEQLAAFNRLLDVMNKLRIECPWDRKQTYESLRPNTIEETYELCDALLRHDEKNICKELGDVLLHVIFYAKIGSENGTFDIADVCNQICDKLIYRHPHVYPPENLTKSTVDSPEAVAEQWEKLKTKEKDGNKSVLSGVPQSLPSIIKAYRIQQKAAGVGFDWTERKQVWEKVKEEIIEFEEEVEKEDCKKTTKEFGDILFSLINVARLYKIDPDNALEHTNNKFTNRFNHIEACAKAKGKNIGDLTLNEMEKYWQEAKKDD